MALPRGRLCCAAVTETLSLAGRLALAWVCFFRVLFDGALAARVRRVLTSEPAALPEPPAPASPPEVVRSEPTAALQLLAVLQREGRLVDFLQQDVASFSDEDIGAAARVVHEGCRRALGSHATVVRVMTEPEGASVTVEEGYDAARLKLVGNVGGKGALRGLLRHAGWRVESLRLPELVGDHDASIVAPAEVEIE